MATLLAGALVLAGCGPSDRYDARPLDQPHRQDVLAPYEAALWPDYLHRMALPRGRDYVILAYVPPRKPLDLSTPERARLSLLSALLTPGPDTTIGHSIVAWQCGAQQGMASMTGAEGPEAIEMVKRGWGLVPLLSTYTDGRLYPEGAHRQANLDALAEGRGVVTAIEVSRSQCEGLRSELTRFLTHPDAPVRNYGLMKDPAAYEGAGCISFGFYLAGAAGVLGEVAPHVTRELALRETILGQGNGSYPKVRLYRPPSGCCDQPLPVLELLFSRWDRGPVVARVEVEDGELMLAALVAARERTAAAQDWRFDRVLPADRDPAVAAAAAAGRSFAARYPVARIADPAGVSALVLERR
ncbi:MAG: hypothetical protein KDK28_01325 [Maritimibacter sp.]|nr:hypothetical protein [Maritimibacter sp.]